MIKRRSFFEVATLLMVIASASALASISTVQGEVLGPWTSETPYPVGITSESCATYSGYIYCVSGTFSYSVYSASVSGGTVGTWNQAPDSYAGEWGPSCSIDAGYMYCVGNGYYPPSNGVYSAPVSSGSIGPWSSATPYPIGIIDESCVTYLGYMYCVGGETATSDYSNEVYSAQVSGGAVGAAGWTASSNLYPTPTYSPSCAIDAGYMYCVGGETETGYVDAVYSASVSSGSVGPWTSATPYPTTVEYQPCVAYAGYIYCVAGSSSGVYYASVSGGTVGTWSSQTPYPVLVWNLPCAADSGYMYCVGGDASGTASDAVYSAPILPAVFTTALTSMIYSTAATSSASTTSGSQTSTSSTTITTTGSPSMTNTLLTTVTTAGSKAGTSTTTFTSPLSTSYSTAASSSVVGTSTSFMQTGTTTTGTSQSSTTTSTETSFSTTSSGGTITVTETDMFNVLLTQVFQELEQFEVFILQTLGFQVTATPVGQQVNQVIVTTATTLTHVTMTVSYSVVCGGSGYSAPVFHYILNGLSKTMTLGTAGKAVSVDAGSAWSVTPNPLTGSGSSQRWYSTQRLQGTAAAGTTVFKFQHQYYLTMKVSSSTAGSVTPSSGWHNAGQTVTIKATAKTGHTFKSWTGKETGSYTGTANPATITMNAAITETANFT